MKKSKPLLALALWAALGQAPVHATNQPYIGQIMCGGWNFAPQGWMELAGQVLSIADNDVLFALIGTTWGGDGQTTFALPDLRGRVVVGSQASLHPLGEVAGTESASLSASQLPTHNHVFYPPASSADATAKTPAGNMPATKARTTLYAPGPGDLAMQAVQSAAAGGGLPVDHMQPYLAVKCAVAVSGIFPSQN